MILDHFGNPLTLLDAPGYRGTDHAPAEQFIRGASESGDEFREMAIPSRCQNPKAFEQLELDLVGIMEPVAGRFNLFLGIGTQDAGFLDVLTDEGEQVVTQVGSPVDPGEVIELLKR